MLVGRSDSFGALLGHANAAWGLIRCCVAFGFCVAMGLLSYLRVRVNWLDAVVVTLSLLEIGLGGALLLCAQLTAVYPCRVAPCCDACWAVATACTVAIAPPSACWESPHLLLPWLLQPHNVPLVLSTRAMFFAPASTPPLRCSISTSSSSTHTPFPTRVH